MNLTVKQIKIMMVIVEGNGRDAAGNIIPVDIDELVGRLDYHPSKGSMQFSIRALIKHGLIYKGERQLRRDRMRVVYFPTENGKATVTGRPVDSILETESDDNLLTLDGFSAAAGTFLKDL